MKQYLFFIAFLFACYQSFGQASVNMNLYKKMHTPEFATHEMFLLVKGDVSQIRDFVKLTGGKYISSAGDIASVRLTVSAISQLVNKPFVKQISSDIYNFKTMNDTMRMRAFVNEVHAGQSPLTSSYKGRGVIIGMIDSGIDFTHPDFKDSLGNTRVLWLWDMNLADSANTPQPYDYGQEFSRSQIDSGLATAHNGTDQFGHGTYTAGIAAGNGNANGRFQGVAPEAELIVVGYDFNAADTVSRMAHAVEYIFNKAQALGMPCVINASLGDYYGSHDGLDLQSQYISYMLNQQSGRVIVQACGDIGVNYPFHVGRNSVSGDTVFTWCKYNVSTGDVYIQIYADTANYRDIRYSIGVDKVTPYFEFRGQTNFGSVFPTINNLLSRDIMNGPNRIGNIQEFTSLNDGVYLHEIYITPDSTDYNWRFITTGNGRYDSWTFDWVFQNLPSDTVFPDMSHYHAPDTISSIVSGINCLSNVISVGNYTNTDRHIDVDTVLQISPGDLPQQIAVNSGRGPTRSGLVKPDVSGPGNHIVSTGVLSLITGLISTQPYKVAQGGYHITGGGTSASAPVVAGIAALYLEENPGGGWLNVKTALQNCAFQDTFMWGPYPNNAWGYGKVHAFEALTTCSLFNSVKNPVVFDAYSIYPNPASSELFVEVKEFRKGSMVIYDLEGRKLLQTHFNGMKFSIPISGLAEGTYLLELKSVNCPPATSKFVVSR